jgi:hypothetical protein
MTERLDIQGDHRLSSLSFAMLAHIAIALKLVPATLCSVYTYRHQHPKSITAQSLVDIHVLAIAVEALRQSRSSLTASSLDNTINVFVPRMRP